MIEYDWTIVKVLIASYNHCVFSLLTSKILICICIINQSILKLNFRHKLEVVGLGAVKHQVLGLAVHKHLVKSDLVCIQRPRVRHIAKIQTTNVIVFYKSFGNTGTRESSHSLITHSFGTWLFYMMKYKSCRLKSKKSKIYSAIWLVLTH